MDISIDEKKPTDSPTQPRLNRLSLKPYFG